MATVTVVKFPTAEGADRLIGTLEELRQQRLVTIEDAAIVTWPAGRKGPKTRHLYNLVDDGALHDSFWGLLFGLLFFIPFLDMGLGAVPVALVGSMTRVGIDGKFIAEIRAKVVVGTSALFLLTSDAIISRLTVALKGQTFDVIATNLTNQDEDKLRETFAA